MSFYKIHKANEKDVKKIISIFPKINDLSKENQEKVCDAFNTVFVESGYSTYEEVYFSKHSTHYKLVNHINEVVEFSLLLEQNMKSLWDDIFTERVDKEELIVLALVHDLDKFILMGKNEETLEKEISHGYLSSLILNDLGFSERIVSLVAYHSPSACKHIEDPLAMILHYSDMLSADHIYMLVGRRPFYCE